MRTTYTMVAVARVLIAPENEGKEFYGTELQQMLNMPPGTLYPILRRFREAKNPVTNKPEPYLTAKWETPSKARREHPGPPRRPHKLTDAGRVALTDMVRKWDATRNQSAVNA